MTGFREALAKATPGVTSHSDSGTSSPANGEAHDDNNVEKEKYLFRVTAGPSYDTSTHKVVDVNGKSPTCFESDDMSVQIRVRIKDYHGLPRRSPESSAYFSDPDHRKSLYSIAFSFVPKKTLPSTDLVWGNDFPHPVRDRLPPGFNNAFRIVKNFIDPGLECDAYADRPWLYGPALSCWFALRVGEDGQKQASAKEMEDDDGIVFEGADGSGQKVRTEKGLPDDSEKRRKYFLDKAHREQFEFEAGRLYQGDFHNEYLDFSNYSLKLPGFSLNVLRYIGERTHKLRYVFKDRNSDEVYFTVVFQLLYGQQLEEVLRGDPMSSAGA